MIVIQVVLVAIVLIVLEIPLGILFARRQNADLAESATRQAALIATFIGPDLDQSVGNSLSAVLRNLPTQAPVEITVVDRSGRILVARHGAGPDEGDGPAAAAVRAASTGTVSTGELTDDGEKWTYAAVPVTSRDSQVGAVLVALPREDVSERIATAWAVLAGLAGGLLVLTALVALWVSRWVSRPVNTLAAAVGRLSAGDLNSVAPSDSGPPELRDLAEQFNDMATRLRNLLDAQRRFVADASHQLRAPLTALRLRVENLDGSPVVDVEPALAEADRLARLLDGLLALSRAEGARPEPQEVDAVAVIRDRLDAWSPLCSESQVELRLVSAPQSALVLIAAGHLEQILDNLIANSLEVSPPGSSIDLAVDRAPGIGPMVVIEVIDHGPGMSDDHRIHAFDRFWQSDTRPTGNAGLGLPIVQQLVASNRGQVALLPTRTGGLTATISLLRSEEA